MWTEGIFGTHNAQSHIYSWCYTVYIIQISLPKNYIIFIVCLFYLSVLLRIGNQQFNGKGWQMGRLQCLWFTRLFNRKYLRTSFEAAQGNTIHALHSYSILLFSLSLSIYIYICIRLFGCMAVVHSNWILFCRCREAKLDSQNTLNLNNFRKLMPFILPVIFWTISNGIQPRRT